ncbi:hypothetical protein HAX54_045597 [Datura stramonium]|uniref:Uncharacterized protein n=1 Tax=Datura stramonium TaxID=4076 RepID=A0ABS8SQX3_DATST|nr:hypothetical protein [Datura stramonium]
MDIPVNSVAIPQIPITSSNSKNSNKSHNRLDFVCLKICRMFENSIKNLFFAKGRTLVDVELGELKFRVGSEEVTFKVCQSVEPPDEYKLIGVLNDERENRGVDLEKDESEDNPTENGV